MKKLVIASAIALGVAGGPALAQSTTAPAGTPPAATAPNAAEREAAHPVERPAPTPRAGDPNTTGPDKVEGMDVPAMKGESGTGR